MDIAEAAGHGNLRIIEAYGAGVFEIANTLINVVIPLNKDGADNHGGLAGGLDGGLDGYGRQVVGELLADPRSSRKQIAARLGRLERTVSRIFAGLREKGVITRVGSRRDGRWKVLKQAFQAIVGARNPDRPDRGPGPGGEGSR